MKLEDLIGKGRCAVVFDAPPTEWPFAGYPAWLEVFGVDKPLVLLGWAGMPESAKWINLGLVKEIIPPSN